MLGAGIEYYDIALYGFMAPVLVNVFLPHLDKTTAYFYYFLFEFFAAICQYMGAKFFGKIGDKNGRKTAMYRAVLGTSIATFLICIVPTYETCGILATILFMSLRALQSFFLGGEFNGGAIYLLEHEKNSKKHGLISGLYCAFTVLGIVFASLVATLCNKFGNEYFRFAYAISFFLALITYRMRMNMKETPEYLKNSSTKTLFKKSSFLSIAVIILFFGVLYGMPTRIMNALLPMTGKIDSNQLMIINTIFLTFYMLLLILFGALSDKFSPVKILKSSVYSACLLAYPLMLLIESGSILNIILAKAGFALLAASCIGPFHAWAQQLYPTSHRYQRISEANAVGKCLSTIVLAFCVKIFDEYHSFTSLGFVLTTISLITIIIFYENPFKRKLEAVPSY